MSAVAFVVFMVPVFLKRRQKSKLNQAQFAHEWQELQQLCKDKKTWPLAIINADKLLDNALKKCNYKGKTMGERLVSAQHDISENDMVWFGHKMRNKLVHEDFKVTKQKDVLEALRGFRQALKDLGALPK